MINTLDSARLVSFKIVQCFFAAWALFSNLINVFKVASIHEAAEAVMMYETGTRTSSSEVDPFAPDFSGTTE
jgi:hypothetical protein